MSTLATGTPDCLILLRISAAYGLGSPLVDKLARSVKPQYVQLQGFHRYLEAETEESIDNQLVVAFDLIGWRKIFQKVNVHRGALFHQVLVERFLGRFRVEHFRCQPSIENGQMPAKDQYVDFIDSSGTFRGFSRAFFGGNIKTPFPNILSYTIFKSEFGRIRA